MYHVDISRRYFFVCQLKIVFYFLHELRQRSSDVTGLYKRPVVLKVTEEVKTTRSNRLKFRLYPDKMIQLLELNCLH